MKHTEMNETSNREMITISRAEYEAMQAQLAEQNQLLDAKSAELAQALFAEPLANGAVEAEQAETVWKFL